VNPRGAARWALAATALALLTCCSTTKLAYNRLDWLASWEIGKYVELEGQSKVLFDSGFASVWQWHRSTQLMAYARDLREIAEASAGPVTTEQIRGYMQRAREHGFRLLEEAVPPTARFLQALDDAQVKDLLENMAEERTEQAEEEAERSPAEARAESIRNMTRGLRRWLGGLSDEQKKLVGDWAAARRDEPALWHRYGEQWAVAFGQLLATRARPDFEASVRDLFSEPDLPGAPAIRELRAHNRETFAEFLGRLAPTLNDRQRRQFHDKLVDFAGDLEELAHPTRAAATAGGIG